MNQKPLHISRVCKNPRRGQTFAPDKLGMQPYGLAGKTSPILPRFDAAEQYFRGHLAHLIFRMPHRRQLGSHVLDDLTVVVADDGEIRRNAKAHINESVVIGAGHVLEITGNFRKIRVADVGSDQPNGPRYLSSNLPFPDFINWVLILTVAVVKSL